MPGARKIVPGRVSGFGSGSLGRNPQQHLFPLTLLSQSRRETSRSGPQTNQNTMAGLDADYLGSLMLTGGPGKGPVAGRKAPALLLGPMVRE